MNPEERKEILSGKKSSSKSRKNASSKRKKKGEKRKDEQPPMTPKEVAISWAKTIVSALFIVMIVNGLFIQSFVVPTGSMENEVMAGDFVFVNRFIYGGSTPQTIPFINVPLPYLRLPGFRDPERGDVIVFIFPGDRDQVEPKEFQYYLKRCVAVAGDTLEIRDGYAYVNGVKETPPRNLKFHSSQQVSASEPYRTFPKGRKYTHVNWGPMRIPKEGDLIKLDRNTINEWRVFIEREGHSVSVDGQIVLIDGKPSDSYTVERDYVFGIGDNRDNSLDSRFWGFVPEEDVVGTPLTVYWSWEPYHGGNPERPKSLVERVGSIRWGRIFNGIK